LRHASSLTQSQRFALRRLMSKISEKVKDVEQGLNPRLAAMLISLTMVVSLIIAPVVILDFRTMF
jgi:predicted permease